jgi:caffeoyl-CoA O-methyltransferase
MFHVIPQPILDRMHALEAIDAIDRVDGTPRARRLRQIPSETGKFLALLVAVAPQGTYIEIGTSAGYSSLWIALACKELGRKLVTFEIDEAKVALAKETFRLAEVEAWVELVTGDARQRIADYPDIAFCFLDAEKEMYAECYETTIPCMVKGGLLVADNVISHHDELVPFLQRAQNDKRVDALVVPIGKGELVCRKR